MNRLNRLVVSVLMVGAMSGTVVTGSSVGGAASAVGQESVSKTVEGAVYDHIHPLSGCSYHHWSYNVERWHSTAMAQGWSQCQWYHLSCIIYRESRGNPMAFNRYDPNGGSLGLTQINRVHAGWLGRMGIIRWPYDLFTAWRNLRAAKALYDKAGWSPWGWCG